MPHPRSIASALALLPLLGCGNAEDGLRLVGTVERTLVELVAPTAEVIVGIAVERGSRIVPGQVLVRLDPTVADAEIARAEARLAGAQTAVLVAQHEFDRAIQLRGRDVTSQQMLDRAQLERSEAHARLNEARAMLAVARKRRSDLDLASAVAGVVDQLPFDLGERVSVGGVVAVVLADGTPWVRVWVPEERFVQVVPGTPAEVSIDGLGRTLTGRVLDVAREPEFSPHYALTERDRVHLVYETRVAIENAPASLRPGVPAEVRMLAGSASEAGP